MSKQEKLAGAPFHERYRKVLVLGAIAGIYLPSLKKIITNTTIMRAFLVYVWICLFIRFAVLLFFPSFHFCFMATTIPEKIFDLMVLFVSTQSTVFSAWFMWNSHNIEQQYQLWDEYFGADGDVKQREVIIAMKFTALKRILGIIGISTMVSINPWFVAQYFEPTQTLKIPTIFPYRHQSPDYEIILTAYILICAFSSLTALSIQVFVLLPVIWMEGQFDWLRISLKLIVNAPLKENLESRFSDELTNIDRKMGIWIQQHQKIFYFFNCSKKILMEAYSFEICIAFMESWLLAFQSLQVTVDVFDKVHDITFFVPFIMLFLIFSYHSDLVKKKSCDVFDEVYPEHWSALPKKQRMSLVIIVQRTQKPIIIRGFKIFPAGCSTFAKIMQSAYSVLNFLLATANDTN